MSTPTPTVEELQVRIAQLEEKMRWVAELDMEALVGKLYAEIEALKASINERPVVAARAQQPARPAQRPHVPCDGARKRTAPIFARDACHALSAHRKVKCWVQVLGDDLFQITKGLEEPSAKVDGYGLIALVKAELAKPKAKTLEETLETPPWGEAA